MEKKVIVNRERKDDIMKKLKNVIAFMGMIIMSVLLTGCGNDEYTLTQTPIETLSYNGYDIKWASCDYDNVTGAGKATFEIHNLKEADKNVVDSLGFFTFGEENELSFEFSGTGSFDITNKQIVDDEVLIVDCSFAGIVWGDGESEQKKCISLYDSSADNEGNKIGVVHEFTLPEVHNPYVEVQCDTVNLKISSQGCVFNPADESSVTDFQLTMKNGKQQVIMKDGECKNNSSTDMVRGTGNHDFYIYFGDKIDISEISEIEYNSKTYTDIQVVEDY
jgi:hypothetical protein